ncbi:unnamed protein product [Citrullus colocynthis]|uniref:Uncharacterized protein n=1 Tax=Citrullus colocynthis TaxID=252529 RepID=A0ABP0YFA8_9ROSI
MANLPRFGRTWQRLSAIARPAPAAAQPASVPEPEILPLAPTTQTLQPFEPNLPAAAAPPSSPVREPTPRISSPAKKAASPTTSPEYEATVVSVASLPLKPAQSPPVSPPSKSSDPRHSISPNSYKKPHKPTTPPLSPLAMPKSVDVTTIQSGIKPEVEQKSGPYKKPDRQTEYGSGKTSLNQQAEAINLAGHNVGAVMEISQFSDKRLGGEVIRKIETESGVRHENDEEKTRRATGFPMTPILNSNFQEVNNSVMYNSSCSGRDPGLHLDFSGKSKDNGATVDGGEKSIY